MKACHLGRAVRLLICVGTALACSVTGKYANADRCPNVVEPVCAAVPPSFCGLPDCGTQQKTFDNACLAQRAGAVSLAPGACHQRARQGYNASSGASGQQTPLFRTNKPVENPYSPERLTALYQSIEGPMVISGVSIQPTRAGVQVALRGQVPEDCTDVQVRQLARLGDSFGVAVTFPNNGGGVGCVGRLTSFERSLVLDPGRYGWARGIEYEIIVNGRSGRFRL